MNKKPVKNYFDNLGYTLKMSYLVKTEDQAKELNEALNYTYKKLVNKWTEGVSDPEVCELKIEKTLQ